MKKVLWLLVALFVLTLCPSAHAAAPSLAAKPLACSAYGAGCTISSFTVSASSDVVPCMVQGLGASTSSCACTGGSWNALTLPAGFTPPAGWNAGVLTNCTPGTNPVVGNAPGASAITLEASDVTGSPILEASNIVMGNVTAGSTLAASVQTTNPDYCPSLIVDALGHGGAVQTPASPFTTEGVGPSMFPENYADMTQTAGSTVTVTWTPHVTSKTEITALMCFKSAPPPPKVTISFKLCDAAGECMNLPQGANTFTLYMMSNGTQSAPLATDSFTILPQP